MPRIIAGIAGGIQLGTAVGQRRLRPTMDRAKESLFAQLEAIGMIEDSAVLDLCAGSGALALESMSRGAQSADLVEIDNVNYRFLQENIAKIETALSGSADNAEIPPIIRGHLIGVSRFLRLTDESKKWDLIFLDPPYAMPNEEITGHLDLLRNHLAMDGLIIVERPAREPRFFVPCIFRIYDAKIYGDAALYWLEFGE